MGKVIGRFTTDGRAEDDIRRKFMSYHTKSEASAKFQKYVRSVTNAPLLSDLSDDEMVKHETGGNVDLYIRKGGSLYKATFTKVE